MVEPVGSEVDDGVCVFDERSPFRPDRRLQVMAFVWSSYWGSGSGTDEARRVMRDFTVLGDQPLPGFGDEATLLIDRSGPHGEVEATVSVRIGNLTMWVDYSEEYASPQRVSEVARIVARESLRRAGIPVDASAGRRLADVPPAKAPDRLRIAEYRRVPERSVLGPVWRGTNTRTSRPSRSCACRYG